MSNKVYKQTKNRPKVGDTIGVLNACGMNTFNYHYIVAKIEGNCLLGLDV